jgi:hypothetical protein
MPAAKVLQFGALIPIPKLTILLKYSIEAIPASYKKKIDLLDSWDEERVKFC